MDNVKIIEISACYNQDMLIDWRGFLPGNAGTLLEIAYIITQEANFSVRLCNGGTEIVNYSYPVVLVNKEF